MTRRTTIFSLGQLPNIWVFQITTVEKVKNVKPSAVYDHLEQCDCSCDCSVDFSNSGILVADASKFNHLIKGSLLITSDNR